MNTKQFSKQKYSGAGLHFFFAREVVYCPVAGTLFFMRILKLHNPTGNPYWDEQQFSVQLDGKWISMRPHLKHNSGGLDYKLFVKPDGIYIQEHASGSGYGRKPIGEMKKIISSNQYDKIEYIGEELKISDELKQDLQENKIWNG